MCATNCIKYLSDFFRINCRHNDPTVCFRMDMSRGPQSCKTFVTKCHTGIFILRSATRTEVHGSFRVERIRRSFMSFLWLALSLFVCNIMDPGISAPIEENRHAPLKCQCKKTLTLHSRYFSLKSIYWILSEGHSSNSLSERFLNAQSSDFYSITKSFENQLNTCFICYCEFFESEWRRDEASRPSFATLWTLQLPGPDSMYTNSN